MSLNNAKNIDKNLLAQAEIEKAKMFNLTEAIATKWENNEIGDGIQEFQEGKRANVAVALESQEGVFKQLSETQISTEYGTRPENMLKVVRLGVANRKRGDIFNEVSLKTLDDTYWFIYTVYGKSLRGATANDYIYASTAGYYAGEIEPITLDMTGAATHYAGNITSINSSPVPIIPFSIKIIVNGALVGSDDGAGNLNFVGKDPAIAATINYQTGDYSFDFSVAPGAKIEWRYNFNSEVSSNYGQLGTIYLKPEKKRFQPRPMGLGFDYSMMTKLFFETAFNEDYEAKIIQRIADEHAKAKDYRAIELAAMVGRKNTVIPFETDFQQANEISDYNQTQKILKGIGKASSKMYNELTRGTVKKIIGTPAGVNYLKNHKLWKTDDKDPRVGVYKAGTLDDIEVFTCPVTVNNPVMKEEELVLVYKDETNDMDTSITFGTLTEFNTKLTYPEGATVGNVFTVEDALIVNPGFIRVMSLTHLDTNI